MAMEEVLSVPSSVCLPTPPGKHRRERERERPVAAEIDDNVVVVVVASGQVPDSGSGSYRAVSRQLAWALFAVGSKDGVGAAASTSAGTVLLLPTATEPNTRRRQFLALSLQLVCRTFSAGMRYQERKWGSLIDCCCWCSIFHNTHTKAAGERKRGRERGCIVCCWFSLTKGNEWMNGGSPLRNELYAQLKWSTEESTSILVSRW